MENGYFIMTENMGAITKITGYYLAFISLGVAFAVLGPTLPALAQITHSDLSTVSILFTARETGTMLTALFGARLYDHFPGHRILTIALLVLATTIALAPLSPTVLVLSIDFLALGLSAGLVTVGGNTLLMWQYKSRVAPYLNGLHFFFGLGSFLAPMVIAQVSRTNGGMQWSYWILALIMLPSMIFMSRLPSPAHPSVTHEDGKGQVNFILIFLLAFFLFLYVAAESSYGGWISSYVIVTGLSNEAVAAYLASAFWGSFTLGRLTGVPLAMRYSPQTILSVALIAGLTFLTILTVFPLSITAIWIGTCGFGFVIGPIVATTVALAERQMHITGRITGLIFLGGSLGAMTVPWIIGRLFSLISPQALFYTLLLILIAAITILLAINGLKKDVIQAPFVEENPL
jgi:FHS family Na+ dependent glucose MFS transporter 1